MQTDNVKKSNYWLTTCDFKCDLYFVQRMSTQYLFLLGRNPTLSRAELLNFCEEVWYDENKSLFIGEKLRFENPRDLPKKHEQLFLDRVGGTIRMGAIVGEYRSVKEVQGSILKEIENEEKEKKESRIILGFSAFGCGREFLKSFVPETRRLVEKKIEVKVRIENSPGQNLTSGRIFEAKLLRKGNEFIIVKNRDSYLLTKTVANQNIRNYTLRDRIKNFRDAKLGMLPPKLAQVLLNLTNPKFDEVVIDPFCGTGTVNIEAAIAGFRTIGSDIDEKVVEMARSNFEQMSEKFRYDNDSGEFFISDAVLFPSKKLSGVVVTEGYLGFNFTQAPTKQEIEKNSKLVMKLWDEFFYHLEKSKISKVSLCLPLWRFGKNSVSISEKLFAKIRKYSYTPDVLFGNQKTFVYSRPGAFVGREICVVKKQSEVAQR